MSLKPGQKLTRITISVGLLEEEYSKRLVAVERPIVRPDDL